jgi:mono/diheme cytochrome c family protein
VRAVALVVAAALGAAGCTRATRDMADQPKLGWDDASPLFADGRAARPPPAGAVAQARGDLAATSSGRLGAAASDDDARADAMQALPARPSAAMLARGRERFAIFCVPCHGALGDGDGRVVRRGFPAPPSYHEARLLAAPDRHFYDVVRDGHGVMHGYGERVPAADRWTIVAYVRALQLSQRMPAAALSPQLRAQLAAPPAEHGR